MEINCTVENIIFRNDESGYTVLNVDADGSLVTAVGIFPIVEEGEKIKLTGQYINHKKYGEQFQVEEFEYIKHQTDQELIRFLSNGLFTGVGKVTAQRIIEYFGDKTFDIIEKEHLLLTKVKGVSKKKAEVIHKEYIDKMSMRDAIMYLQKLEISMGMALKIFAIYKADTENIVKENPYQLIEDIDGIGFFKADIIAEKLGIESTSPFRIRAGIVHTLKESEKLGGHTALPIDLLIDASKELLRYDDIDMLNEAVDTLVFGGYCTKFKRLTDDGDNEIMIALSKNYVLENGIAAGLIKMQSRCKTLNVDVDKDIARFEREKGVNLHEKQKEAIKSALNNGIVVISGGPGTGKTTIVNCIVDILKANNLKVELAAPTGRAAKRMTDATGIEARTMHRLLGFKFEGGSRGFTYNENNQLEVDVVIVDEISMADIYIFNTLVKAMPAGSRLILVGDCDQLPSVSAGNILADVIASNMFSVNYLTYVYRQTDGSCIISNAHRINAGEMPLYGAGIDDFYFFDIKDREKQTDIVVSIVKERLNKGFDIKPEDVQVLCPAKRGMAGVEMLNTALQNALNPDGKEYIYSRPPHFRVGDKVMHIRNNYDKEWIKYYPIEEKGMGIFNGDMGYVEGIIGDKLIVLMEDGRKVEYEQEDMEELMLAYAVSVHKSQGSEFPVVVVSVTPGSPMLLAKNLLYTAVTRAKNMVVLVGDVKNVYRMVKNDYTEKRYTLLTDLLLKNQKKLEMLS